MREGRRTKRCSNYVLNNTVIFLLAPSVRAFTCDLLQRRVKGLEDANRKLRAEASQLASDSSETEQREEQILQDLANQLGTVISNTFTLRQTSYIINVVFFPADANNHIKNQDDELANKYEESCKQREEITSLIGQLVSQKHKIREVRPLFYY